MILSEIKLPVLESYEVDITDKTNDQWKNSRLSFEQNGRQKQELKDNVLMIMFDVS